MHEDYIRWFFNENGLKRDEAPPTAMQARFHIKLLLGKGQLQDVMDVSVFNKLPDREEVLQAERNEIESATSSGEIIRFMRRGADIMNQNILVNRALDFEEEIIPEIIKMLKTSLNELFIELSTRALAICSMDISKELSELYEEARSPFTKSMVLVVLGFKGEEGQIPWLVKKFKEMKKSFPETDYCYGAYSALLEMESRFYSAEKKFEQLPV